MSKLSAAIGRTFFSFIFLSGAVGSENRVNAMSCAEYLKNPENPSFTREHQLANLYRAGFKKLGGSDYFNRAGFLVKLHADGSFSLYSSINPALGSPEFSLVGVRINKSDYQDELKLFFATTNYGRNDFVYRSYGLDEGSGPANIHEVPVGSQRDVLINGGAQVDPATPSLIHVSLYNHPKAGEERRKPKHLIALMEGDNLIQVFAPVREGLSSHIGPGTEIIDFRLRSNESDHGISAIRLRQKSLEYEISDDYSGGSYLFGSQTARYDLADVSNEELRLKLTPDQAKSEDQWIGGFNVSAWERAMPISIFNEQLGPNNIQTLRNKLKPGNSSTSGFLGENESLESVLIADDHHVRNDLKLTHQQIGGALLKIIAGHGRGFPDQFTFMGYHLHLKSIGWRGSQYSPFNDGSSASYDVILTNLDNGKAVKFSALVPHIDLTPFN